MLNLPFKRRLFLFGEGGAHTLFEHLPFPARNVSNFLRYSLHTGEVSYISVGYCRLAFRSKHFTLEIQRTD